MAFTTKIGLMERSVQWSRETGGRKSETVTDLHSSVLKNGADQRRREGNGHWGKCANGNRKIRQILRGYWEERVK